MSENIVNAAKEIVDKISKLPAGSEFVFATYFADYKFDTRENFDLMKETLSLCKDNNIDIINLQEDMILGMPWVYTYKKNN